METSEEIEPTIVEVKPKEAKEVKGRWSNEEHQRFLEALKLHGKDWDKIRSHVATRDILNLRAHAQKFLVKLLKFIEGQATLKEMTLKEAEFYYGTLSRKLHKTMKPRKTRRTDDSFLADLEYIPRMRECPGDVDMELADEIKTKYDIWSKRKLKELATNKDLALGHEVRVIQKAPPSEKGSRKI
mmetsp:Transcript_11265/g.17076  ORF Transcript_11265/g.17076 Transcript_11265/m.17076 type:complete len:185 (+) Transcript_11265:457-1011(+)